MKTSVILMLLLSLPATVVKSQDETTTEAAITTTTSSSAIEITTAASSQLSPESETTTAASSEAASGDSSTSVDTGDTTLPTTTVSTTTTATTTTLPPIGTSRVFVFNSGGFTSTMTFTQTEKGLEMNCQVSTSPGTEAFQRFCDTPSEKKPVLYLIDGYTDCSLVPTDQQVQAAQIAILNTPNENALDMVQTINYNQLNQGCLTILQAPDALPAPTTAAPTTAAPTIAPTDSLVDGKSFSEWFLRQGRQDAEPTTTAAPTDTTTEEEITTTEAPPSKEQTTAATTTSTAAPTEATTTTEDPLQCPAKKDTRKKRLIMVQKSITRTFTTITLSNYVIFSTGSNYVAPVYVSSNVGSSISFGSIGSYTYDPWKTWPIIPLPNWSSGIFYGIAAAIVIAYAVAIYGISISNVSSLANRAYDTLNTPATKKFNDFLSRKVDNTIDRITDVVYSSINRFKRRNYYSQQPAEKYYDYEKSYYRKY